VANVKSAAFLDVAPCGLPQGAHGDFSQKAVTLKCFLYVVYKILEEIFIAFIFRTESTSQETSIDICTAVRTLNLKSAFVCVIMYQQ
jgi:hypothetical protein